METSTGPLNPKPKFNPLSRTNLIWGGNILLVIGFVILAYRGVFNRYWADDWCYNWNFKDLGLIGTLEGYYNILLYASNRYSLTFFSWVFYNLGIFGVQILPVLVIGLWVGGAYQLSGNLVKLFKAPVGKAERFFLASLLVYATLFMAPNQFQILYWRSAVMPYTFPLLSLLFLLTVITRHMSKPYRGWWIGLFAGLMAFIAVGFSEIGGTYIMGVLAILLMLVLIFKKRLPHFFQRAVSPLSIALAAGFVALLVLALCPSNELRRVYSYYEMIPLVELPGLVLSMTVTYIKSYYLGYTLPILMLAVTGAFFSAGKVVTGGGRPAVSWKKRGLLVFILLVSAFLACIAMLLPSAYVEHAVPEEGRAMIIGCFTLTLTTLWLALLAGQWAGEVISRQKWISGWMLSAAGLLLFLGLAAYAARTYTYPIKTIPFFEKRAQVWDERDATIRQALAEGKRDVDVREIDSYAGVLELHPQPNWVNGCAAEFYGLDEIRSTIPWD